MRNDSLAKSLHSESTTGPTIFALASEGLGPRAASASGIIGVAIVGGAVIPPLTGHVADLIGLRAALLIPAICYGRILAYGLYARRPAVATIVGLKERR